MPSGREAPRRRTGTGDSQKGKRLAHATLLESQYEYQFERNIVWAFAEAVAQEGGYEPASVGLKCGHNGSTPFLYRNWPVTSRTKRCAAYCAVTGSFYS